MVTTPMDTLPADAHPKPSRAVPTGPTTSPWSVLRQNPFRFLRSSAPWRGLAYLAVSLVFGWICFCLYVVIVLIPFAPGWSYYLAMVERQRVRLLGVVPIANPHPTLYRIGFAARAGERLGEAATWRETGYSLILAAFAPLMSLGLMVYFGAAGMLLLAPAIAPGEEFQLGGWVIDSSAEAWTLTVIAVPVLVLGVYLCACAAAGLASLCRGLLGPREEELTAQVADLRASRGILVDSFEGERRKIERDLHDGPQRDLVGVSMQLGELQLATDDDSVRSLAADAQARVEQALAGLRDTVRGVHPRVLDDHGVPAACVELGGPMPVRVAIGDGWEHGTRLPVDVERAMYYTASEAVTNAVKHSSATGVTITFSRSADTDTMEIVDDGVGGADSGAGTGLAGLAERASAVGASLEVASPTGGPTRLLWSKRR
ncbi:sensor histidine kinase [Gordonia sp. SL306]|uniref:sensor histidine kinase n=1 Tax=Gordonia sp. SL306 TaxID=2995145 RepID=UPI00226FF8A7|nr:sensor histidine kinase [Gordonia sp. SL306]WAC54277.1 sensor domain-containing protein [Gordonia sp. SL306]